MPKAFLLTHKRYELFNLNVPYSSVDPSIVHFQRKNVDPVKNNENFVHYEDVELKSTVYKTRKTRILLGLGPNDESKIAEKIKPGPTNNVFTQANDINQVQNQNKFNPKLNYREDPITGSGCGSSELFSKQNEDNCTRDQHFLNSQGPVKSTTSVPSTEALEDLEQPVNLSLKKSDLFNLTQLAEVSLAAAKCESEFRSIPRSILSSISVTSPSSSSCSSGSEASSSSDVGPSRTLTCNNHTHVCSQCGKGFSTLSNLARHRQTHRSPNDSSAVKKCPHCDKMYVSMPAFSMHLRTHNQGCKCVFCGKGFSRPWLLQGHIRTHTGEKPFSCSICSKSFADKSNLRAHTQTHSNEKPFYCSRCNKNFALKSYLMKHIESSCMRTSSKINKNFNNMNLNSPDSKRSCGEQSPKSDSS